jgi:hypothetical protein
MKSLIKSALLASAVAFCLLGPSRSMAQPGPGNFDPVAMRQRMMDQYRERLEIKNDDEWKVVQERIEKVVQARMSVSIAPGMFRGPGGPGGAGGFRSMMSSMGVEPNPEADALQECLDANAPQDTVKGRLTSYREARKAKEAKLKKAQEDLKQVLSLKQEAIMVLAGMLE